MVRGLISQRGLASRGSLWLTNRDQSALFGISTPFGGLFPTAGQIIHVLLTRAPLYSDPEGPFLVRLACVRHAASVCSEPGSNSPVLILKEISLLFYSFVHRTHKSFIPLFSFQRACSKRAWIYSLSLILCQVKFIDALSYDRGN